MVSVSMMIMMLSIQIASAQITTVSNVTAVNPRHRVAVIPVTYIADGSDKRTDEMRFFLQDMMISYMSSSAAELKFVDAATVNAVLLKDGLDDDNLRRYTPKELAAILQVEYVIMGTVLQSMESVVTTEHNQNTRKQTIEHWGHDTKVRQRNTRTGSSVTRQNVETQVSISIYNDMGDRIYSKSRESILSEGDAYRNAMHYLLKRTPLYRR